MYDYISMHSKNYTEKVKAETLENNGQDRLNINNT